MMWACKRTTTILHTVHHIAFFLLFLLCRLKVVQSQLASGIGDDRRPRRGHLFVRLQRRLAQQGEGIGARVLRAQCPDHRPPAPPFCRWSSTSRESAPNILVCHVIEKFFTGKFTGRVSDGTAAVVADVDSVVARESKVPQPLHFCNGIPRFSHGV